MIIEENIVVIIDERILIIVRWIKRILWMDFSWWFGIIVMIMNIFNVDLMMVKISRNILDIMFGFFFFLFWYGKFFWGFIYSVIKGFVLERIVDMVSKIICVDDYVGL